MEKKVNFKPLNRNMLVIAPVIDEKTKSGIIKSEKQITDEKKNMDIFLEVAAISDDVSTVIVGDKILISGSQKGFELDGTLYFIVHELSLIGKRE